MCNEKVNIENAIKHPEEKQSGNDEWENGAVKKGEKEKKNNQKRAGRQEMAAGWSWGM